MKTEVKVKHRSTAGKSQSKYLNFVCMVANTKISQEGRKVRKR